MIANLARRIAHAGLAASLVAVAGCGDTSQGQAPALVVIEALEVASGATPSEFGGTLLSDVITNVTTPAPCSTTSPCPTIFNDVAEVEMSLRSRDPGVPGIGSNPSTLNAVMIQRYTVRYIRTDGRNVQGVDVPYAFDSAVAFTVPHDGTITAGFEIVRHAAKTEAPLKALASTGGIISTIAEVTFYGRDLAGNDVRVTAQVGIDFGDFADPS